MDGHVLGVDWSCCGQRDASPFRRVPVKATVTPASPEAH